MIGSIDYQADILLYLEAEEIKKLQNGRLEGVLVKMQKPKMQGIIGISINDARKYENGFGIGVDDKKYWGVSDGFHLELFMGAEWYNEFVERGVVGLRQQMMDGSKVQVYDKSKLSFSNKMLAEHLEFYRDNKWRLLSDVW